MGPSPHPLPASAFARRRASADKRAGRGSILSPWLGSAIPERSCALAGHGTERACNHQVPPMSKPPSPPSLADLRKEIDAIDEGVHRLLMQRGDIIDRLIQVKQTQEVGSAFRPAREADMMRRLVERHRGILPIDTVEGIWRVIISTFTYVQAPFAVHADVSVGESAMRD